MKRQACDDADWEDRAKQWHGWPHVRGSPSVRTTTVERKAAKMNWLFNLVFPILFAVIAWGGIWLRNSRLRELMPLVAKTHD
ncbi:MAG: hypothetical protein JO336_15995 [Acidobacteriia bacterium]|nr:hypothetical protein [Terriglobia bacterium]MBV8905567.1 hypothetical protein [Terriglobia bacterium]